MIFLLDATDPNAPFPDPSHAETEPNGLLALGGDLSPRRLIAAYSAGIFPWFSEDQPLLWWSPDPRMVLFPSELKVSRSLRKRLRGGRFEVSIDQVFDAVIKACADARPGADGTWLTAEMIRAYQRLYAGGLAHSVETWLDGELVGGLYGVALGRVFFGESMFSRQSDASKVALVKLVEHLQGYRFRLIDCQVYSEHLASLGARNISRRLFQNILSAEIRDVGCDAWASSPINTRQIGCVWAAS